MKSTGSQRSSDVMNFDVYRKDYESLEHFDLRKS